MGRFVERMRAVGALLLAVAVLDALIDQLMESVGQAPSVGGETP